MTSDPTTTIPAPTNPTPPAQPVLTVTTGALPASAKVHVAGVIHPDIRVPMREIALHPSAGEPPLREIGRAHV